MMIAFKVTKALICQVKINHLKRHLLLATTNHRCRHTKSNSNKLLSYRPPDWASHLQMIPLVKVKNLSETGCHGNMLLNSLMGASMYLVPIKAQEKTDLEPRMQRLADRLQEEKGIKAYSIPIGGSNVVGLHGYLCGWQELLEQGVTDRFDDVILTVGRGGTAAGVAIGNFLYWIPSQLESFLILIINLNDDNDDE
ncbi:bifunctional D-cysteine desulfhydrase/1-aminocyclopropane-1-carboxylate deaminase, mitochondrial-like [Anneissia japonica]|uniref:bifunctional D-cysteine desulfhydrase/1-aminocyclopropane-1-carboxylate deaminase, mitochondrial-like n=1 Tax=Anneissia japonica TaxID=1529436 RepID=UPI001425A6CF|nr:bifunctional D-cysteine desulfhydrase/1-aminocyclopropane-1-carboxylate deaminase, mitochondrial-like [Anneissia japonica]